jgi:hypothetical protein
MVDGIQYAMEAARLAAETLCEAFATGDLGEQRLNHYQLRIDRAFGWQLWISMQTAAILERYPFLLDGAARVIQRNGDFVHAWCSVCATDMCICIVASNAWQAIDRCCSGCCCCSAVVAGHAGSFRPKVEALVSTTRCCNHGDIGCTTAIPGIESRSIMSANCVSID